MKRLLFVVAAFSLTACGNGSRSDLPTTYQTQDTSHIHMSTITDADTGCEYLLYDDGSGTAIVRRTEKVNGQEIQRGCRDRQVTP